MLQAPNFSKFVPCLSIVLAAGLAAEASYGRERPSERYSLIGSIAASGKARQKSVAMIRDKDSHKAVVVKIGQRLGNGDSVLAIEKNRVVIGSNGSRLVVERDAWATESANESPAVADSSSDTPYFGSAPEVTYDPSLEQQVPDMNTYPNSYPVDPGGMPPPPPPPPPAYPYPQNYGGGSYPQNFNAGSGYPAPGGEPMNVPAMMTPDGTTAWQAPVVNPQ